MVRHRKNVKSVQIVTNNETASSSSASSEVSTKSNKTFHIFSGWKTGVGVVCLLVAVYVSILGYLETRVNTPFDDEKVVKESGPSVPERYWGTYRPGVYMGMRSRSPRSPVFGLMWYELAAATHKGIRHWCDQNDNLPTYGWQYHDGVSFGEQLISDPPHNIVTSFLKHKDGLSGWTVRINVTSQNNINSPIMLIWYGAMEDPVAQLWAEKGSIVGLTQQDGHFSVHTHTVQGRVLHQSYTEAHAPGLHVLKEKLYSLLKVERHPNFGRLAVLGPDDTLSEKDFCKLYKHQPKKPVKCESDSPTEASVPTLDCMCLSAETPYLRNDLRNLFTLFEDKEINFVPIQLLVEPPYIVDITYSTEESIPALKGDEYTRTMKDRKRRFDEKFEAKFNLSEKGYSEQDVGIAKAALSNMVGGIGYFYGAGRVRSQYTKEPVPYWRAPLYTAVPSRSFFPRGFLWDEGFHNLLIGRWSATIMMDIAAHWMDLLNVEGWIPREQILGSEALARVPKEFVVQSNAAANPPMLLVTLGNMVSTHTQQLLKHRGTLARIYPRLQAWFNWFQTSQRGEEPTAYRWRGREDDGVQLNPKSLSSGLDDYPRASHPSELERHLDLRCWMYAAADALAKIANFLQLDATKYEDIRLQLSDEELLNELHWSPLTQTYADYGLHSDSVRLVRTQAKNPGEQSRVIRAVSVAPQPRLVTSVFGYISLFPMLLKVLRPGSEKLGKILETLDNPDLLWSPFGLRSLSKSSPFYMKRNTEHDPPYWRGQIWVNMNYLALSALRHYANSDSVNAARARQLHDTLRDNLVRNILSEYKRTGYLWEQYNDMTGHGSGCRPFTGWTALLVNIMAGEY